MIVYESLMSLTLDLYVGGKMDDTDYHETECALRETEEEIGLKSDHIDVSFFLKIICSMNH